MVHWGQLFFFFCSVPVRVLTLALVIVYIRRLLFLMMMIGGGDSRVCANDYSFLLCHVLLFPSSLSSGKQIIIIRPSTSTRVLVFCHCCNYSRFVPRCTAAAAATTLIKLSINLNSSSSSSFLTWVHSLFVILCVHFVFCFPRFNSKSRSSTTKEHLFTYLPILFFKRKRQQRGGKV